MSSAPSAQQHAGLQPVPKSHGMVWRGFAENSIKPERRPTPQSRLFQSPPFRSRPVSPF